MKIIFLDIDGVLNSVQSSIMFHRRWRDAGKPQGRRALRDAEFCPLACSNFLYILEKIPDLKIVLSSTWRLGLDHDGVRHLLMRIGVKPEQILGRTPFIYAAERGVEIQRFLEALDPSKFMMPVVDDYLALEPRFIILDDDSDMAHLKDHLIQTDYRIGLSWIEVEKILKRFEAC